MRFAPGINIRIHLDRILKHFEIFVFLSFLFVGHPHKNLKFYRLGYKKVQIIIKSDAKVFGHPPKNFS